MTRTRSVFQGNGRQVVSVTDMSPGRAEIRCPTEVALLSDLSVYAPLYRCRRCDIAFLLHRQLPQQGVRNL